VSLHLFFLILYKILEEHTKVVRLRPRKALDFSEFSVSELGLGDTPSRPRFFLQFKDWLNCLALSPGTSFGVTFLLMQLVMKVLLLLIYLGRCLGFTYALRFNNNNNILDRDALNSSLQFLVKASSLFF
jgi:hypothetical protein